MYVDKRAIEGAIRIAEVHQKAWMTMYVHDRKKREEKVRQLDEIVKVLRWAEAMLREATPQLL